MGAETTPDPAKGIWWRKALVVIFALASEAAKMAKTYVLPAVLVRVGLGRLEALRALLEFRGFVVAAELA